MDLRQLRYFIAVAEELNYHRAAQRLYISEPPLSLQIRQLEREFGGALLLRSTRSVKLTPLGALLLSEGRKLLEHADQVNRAMRRASDDRDQRVILGSSGWVQNPIATVFLQAANAADPPLGLGLRGLSSHEQLVRALENHDIDVGLTRLPVRSKRFRRLVVDVETTVAAVPSHSTLASKPSLQFSDLAALPFVHFPRDQHPELHDRILQVLSKHGITPSEIIDSATKLDLIAAGACVGLTNNARAAVLEHDGVTIVPLDDDHELDVPVVLLWRRDDVSPKVGRLVQIAGSLVQSKVMPNATRPEAIL